MGDDIKYKEFTKLLTDEDFLRVEFYKKKGKIFKFCLQYDSLIEDRIRTILRVDNSHDSPPHRHVYHKNKKQTKFFLSKNPHLAFNESQSYILQNFKKIKDNYLFS